VDIRVEFYPSGKVVWERGVAANSTVTIRDETDRGTAKPDRVRGGF
jgi:hypothetical protein